MPPGPQEAQQRSISRSGWRLPRTQSGLRGHSLAFPVKQRGEDRGRTSRSQRSPHSPREAGVVTDGGTKLSSSFRDEIVRFSPRGWPRVLLAAGVGGWTVLPAGLLAGPTSVSLLVLHPRAGPGNCLTAAPVPPHALQTSEGAQRRRKEGGFM